MFFRVVFLIVIVCLVLYALFIFLRYFDTKETKPVETPKSPTPKNDDPEAFLKKVELEIELMHTAIEECESRLKAGIKGEEERLESLNKSLSRVEKLKEEYINKNK